MRKDARPMARELYLLGKTYEEIARIVGAAVSTIAKWGGEEGWVEQRTAMNVSRPELRNKLLRITDAVIKKYDDGEMDERMGDNLVKLTTSIKNLDIGLSIVDIIEVFTGFTKWLEHTSALDPRLTVDFRKSVNTYLDAYIRFKTNE